MTSLTGLLPLLGVVLLAMWNGALSKRTMGINWYAKLVKDWRTLSFGIHIYQHFMAWTASPVERERQFHIYLRIVGKEFDYRWPKRVIYDREYVIPAAYTLSEMTKGEII